jgi:hypothetical protein
MKRIVILGVAAAALAGAGTAIADRYPELNPNLHFHPTKDNFAHVSGAAKTSNLTYHGGPVIHSAHVVPIFWGPSWGAGGADAATATHVIQFFGQFGTNAHYAIITQYSDGAGAIQTSNLGNVSYFDSSTPPTNVTDADMQAEVLKAIGALGSFDASAIYEVFIPPASSRLAVFVATLSLQPTLSARTIGTCRSGIRTGWPWWRLPTRRCSTSSARSRCSLAPDG